MSNDKDWEKLLWKKIGGETYIGNIPVAGMDGVIQSARMGVPAPKQTPPKVLGAKTSDTSEIGINAEETTPTPTPTPTWAWGKQEELDDAWESYNKGFSYNLNADPFYQQMVNRYTKSAQLGMEDTMGKAAALTGGYGNSYAQTAGQQAYYREMEGLNDIAMDLYNNAYARWRDSKNDALTKWSLLSEQKANDYEQYLYDSGLKGNDGVKLSAYQEYQKISALLANVYNEAGGGKDGQDAVAKEIQKFGYDEEMEEALALLFAGGIVK